MGLGSLSLWQLVHESVWLGLVAGRDRGPHYWRPAMVGFFGWGAPGIGVGIGFGFGFGHVGWVPLAPFEVFHPWYGAGAVAFRAGVSNIGVANAFRNARVNGAISSMRATDFGHAGVSGAEHGAAQRRGAGAGQCGSRGADRNSGDGGEQACLGRAGQFARHAADQFQHAVL